MGRWRQQKRPAIKDQWNHSYKKGDIETYSTHNEGISVATERLIRTLKNKMHKYHKILLIRPIYEHIWGIYGQRTIWWAGIRRAYIWEEKASICSLLNWLYFFSLVQNS